MRRRLSELELWVVSGIFWMVVLLLAAIVMVIASAGCGLWALPGHGHPNPPCTNQATAGDAGQGPQGRCEVRK